MEPPVTETKYQKLASEYAKLRAQASVLKKAVLEEQSKSAGLREQLRQRETALRRSEQEVDSLGFRNKQLEQRVAALQAEISASESRKREKEQKRVSGKAVDAAAANGGGGELAQDALIFEELQKKIMENAQLTTLIDDKERALLLHVERVNNLEQSLAQRASEYSELEKRLRRELEVTQNRNSELETKLVEAASMLGSEDALSVSGSDHTPLHNSAAATSHHAAASAEEHLARMESELLHWRTQYEIAKMNETFGCCRAKELNKKLPGVAPNVQAMSEANSCSCSSSAAGLSIKPSTLESKGARDSLKEPPPPPTKEQLLYDNFSSKFEALLKAKCHAESQLRSYTTEAEHLQICLENATHELKAKDEQFQSLNQALQMLEEDLATTRVNYEEQISVLTEQVISLSEQLAACK